MLNRKLLRKQARQAKKQRKAEHYQRHRTLVSAPTKRSATPSRTPPQPTSSKPVKTPPRLPRREKGDGNHGEHDFSSRSTRRSRPEIPVIQSSDLLVDFAERAIEQGILGSDGEFDEEKMDQLLG